MSTMPPQRRQPERHFRVAYQFEGNYRYKRFSVPQAEATADLDIALRRAAAKHETLLACLFHQVTLMDWEEF
jgi:hypothetical protein